MRRSLLNKLNLSKSLRQALVLFTMLLLPSVAWGQITVAGYAPDQNGNISGDGITGSVTFASTGDNSGTLTLNNATINGTIVLDNTLLYLIVDIIGTNTIQATNSAVIRRTNNEKWSAIWFTSSTKTGSLTLENIGGNSDEGLLYYIEPNSIEPNPIEPSIKTLTPKFEGNSTWSTATEAEIKALGLTVAGVTVTTGNNTDILDGDNTGKVSFTPAGDTTPATLTLENATIIPEGEGRGISYTGTDNLTISLKGSNTVKGVGGCNAILYDGTGAATPTLTFTNGGTEACSLQLEAENTQTIGGFANVINTGLYKIDETILGADQSNTYKTIITTLGGGSGTSSDPIIIKTAEDLRDFAKLVNRGTITNEYIKLNPEGGELDCNGLTGFEPIGILINSSYNYPFIGKFDGNNCTIKNLTYSTNGTGDRVGLFGYVGNENVSDTKIEKLTLSNCSFNGGEYVGGIVGELKNGTIENCVLSSCTVKSGNAQIPYAGGIAGYVDNGTISTCTFNSGLVDCTTAYDGEPSNGVHAGGIVGYIDSANSVTVSSCIVSSTEVKSVHSGVKEGPYDIYAGGLVGRSLGTVAISGNKVTTKDKTKKISCQSGVTYTNYHCGAVIGDKGDATTLSNNTYEYDVTTEIVGTTISGYTQRGVGGSVYNTETQQDEPNPDVTADNGAVMYTKTLTVGVSNECESDYYEPLTNYENGILAFAPGQTIDIELFPADGVTISSASLVYTPTGGTEQTVPLENKSETAGEYNYVFEMPDADATLNATIVQTYDLWIGETQVTSTNAANVLGDGKVSFTESVGVDTAPTYTLTLNGATLTVPVKVGLANLTIDIQGTNTITTNTTCIQNTAATGVPSLTFKSSGDVVGSLTLTDTDEEGTNGVISDSFFEHFTISKELALVMLRYGNYTSDTYYFTAGEVHYAQLLPSYGVQVNDMQVYAGNAEDVLGDGKVSFDEETATLTLNNASGISTIRTSLSTLNIDLVGSNSLYRESNGSILESASGEAVTINLKSTGATGSLTIETPANYGATLKGDNVTLKPVDPIVLLSSDVTDNKGTLLYGVSYGLTVAGVTVSNVNASNVLGGATATVVFTPADNTASPATPATLTLNGADNLGTILSGLENLKIVINGENAAVGVSANSAVSGDKNITFEGGTNGGTLAISAGDGGSVVSGFASVSYVGAYAAADIPFGYDKTASQQGYRKSHMMDDNSYLETLTITTVPHYPIWLYTNVTTSTQINNTNKNTLLDASGNVSFDGNNTLSLKNGVNCEARIVSGLSELTISIDGDCIIESPDSGSVVRSINSSAPLTIEKASGASSATLKLAAVSYTAIKAFASLDYTGLVLLSDGATYSSGALKDSKGEPLNVANFTSSLKRPTIQMNYENDTYSFQNPNAGGTLKYSRYFANNEGTDEENQVDNGTTTFQIFKNGRQYNDPYTVIYEVWVEANGNSSDKLYACRLDIEDMTTTYGGTVPTPVFLPKSVEGATVSGYSLGTHEAVAATVTEGSITLTGAGRQELDAIFSIPEGVEYIKTSTTETPQATFYLDVKPATPILSQTSGTFAGTLNVKVTNLTPNATAMYYTYESDEPASPDVKVFPEDGVDISSSKTLAVYYMASYETETSTEYLYSETVRETYTQLPNPGLLFVQGSNPVEGKVDYTIGGSSNPTLPTLQKPEGVTVTYTSSATGVATVAADGTVTPVGIGSTTITATSEQTTEYAAGEAFYTLNVYKSLSHSSITVEISDVTYNGQAQTPTVTVKDGDDVLPYGEDNGGGTMLYAYKVDFANNTNAALATAETDAPTATITALTDGSVSHMEVNWYRGSTTKTFTISPMSISTATVSVDPEQTYAYTGAAIEPNVSSVSIKLTEGADAATNLTAGTDYTVTGYANNINAATATSENAPTVTITGKGNFTGTASGKFTIEQADLSGYVVTGLTTPTAYTGSPITPAFSVKATETAETSLTLNTDYSVKYQQAGADVDEMKDAGAYKILISGQGNYKGSLDADFTIDRATLNLTINLEGWTYGDTPNVPSLDGNLDEGAITWEYKATGAEAYSAWSDLTKTTDAGTYMVKATVAETDNYAGSSKEAEFVIEQLDISQADITLDNNELTYNGQEQTVIVTKVMVGDIEVPIDCYEVSGNTEKEVGDYKLTVTAKTMDGSGNPIKNNFTGSAEKDWKIKNRTASAAELGFKSETQIFSTYYNPNEDIYLPDGYMSYVITGINDNNSVSTQRLTNIPKGIAVLVEKGTNSENPTDVVNNPDLPLKGTAEPREVSSITGGTVYVLYNGEFVKSTRGTIPAKRCYLLIENRAAAGTRAFGINHQMGANGIDSALLYDNDEKAGDKWHDLQGRSIEKPTKAGLYIKNGKKVVIK